MGLLPPPSRAYFRRAQSFHHNTHFAQHSLFALLLIALLAVFATCMYSIIPGECIDFFLAVFMLSVLYRSRRGGRSQKRSNVFYCTLSCRLSRQ